MALTVRGKSPYELLKQAILSGEFRPGQQLVETALADWCKVSRTPIREALRRLEQDGLVTRSDRGMIVPQRSTEELFDIYETRIPLEATVGRLAAERRTDHDLRSLQRAVKLAQDVDPGSTREIVEANARFHRAVRRASHNESLIDVLERLDLHLARYPQTALEAPGRWQTAHDDHVELLDAIVKRDGERAHQVALQHYTAVREIRLAQFLDEEEL